MTRKKTYAERIEQRRIAQEVRRTDGILALLNNLVRNGFIVWGIYYIYLMVDAIAGKMTKADVNVGLLGDLSVTVSLAWTVGLTGFAYGWHQRRLRKNVIERYEGRVRKLEAEKDPRRSSSKLTPRGDTRPEDAI